MPPSAIFLKLLSRSFRAFRRHAIRALRLDSPRLTPRLAAAILKFRTAAAFVRTALPVDVPSVVKPVVTGVVAEVHIKGVFPRAMCFVQVDLQAFAIRWTNDQSGFFSAHTVEGVQLNAVPSSNGLFVRLRSKLQLVRVDSIPGLRRSASRPAAVDATPEVSPRNVESTRSSNLSSYRRSALSRSLTMRLSIPESHRLFSGVRIRYTDRKAIPRVLELRMARHKAAASAEGFQALLKSDPNIASPAHWRWVLSCMMATSQRGAAGYLRATELRSLLVRANASPHISTTALKEMVDESEQRELVQWLLPRPAGANHQPVLNVRHVAHLLLRLGSLTHETTMLFNRYATHGRMPLAQWLTFIRNEQLTRHEDEDETRGASSAREQAEEDEDKAEIVIAQRRFDQAASSLEPQAEKALDRLQFALQLLSLQNDAVTPVRHPDATADLHTQDLQQPLAHLWTAASHNSYLIGDQLTGISTPDAYRRQLVQVR